MTVSGKNILKIEEICQTANFNNSIQLNNLAYLFAADDGYTESLNLLLRKFVSSNEILCRTFLNNQSENINLNSYERRLHFWDLLWNIFAGTSDFHWLLNKFNFKISHIPLYRDIECEISISKDKEREDYYYVQLDDLKSFIKKIEESFKIPFPFPQSFSSDYQKLPKAKVFPCPEAQWEDIKITLVSNESVRIKTPMGEARYSYHEIGMSDKRSGDKPNQLWTMLKYLLQNHGIISREDKQYKPKFPDLIKRLNKRLQKLFEINESVFPHYKKSKSYKSKIFMSDQTIVCDQS